MENKEYYVDRHNEEKIEFGLDKIYKLLNVMGCPQDKLKVIHIAGTNGKGSVSNYIMYILAYAGFKVGKISSPVVFSKMEFAQIATLKLVNNKKNISECEYYVDIVDANEEKFNRLVDKYKLNIEQIKPSGYEIQIAFSLEYLLEEKCDIVIVETGMGGSLDATNVFKRTLCDVLTSISIDHIGMIGNNLEEITECKCGIITEKGSVVTTSSNNEIMDIIKNRCSRCEAYIYMADMSQVTNIKLQLNNNSFMYGQESYVISLNGRHQIENAIIAIKVIEVLRENGYDISHDMLVRGLKETKQKGRCDIVYRTNRTAVIADGAHNESGARCLVRSIEDYMDIDNSRVIYVLSIFKDKEYKKIISNIVSNADEIWTFDTNNPRCMKSEELYDVVRKVISERKNDDISTEIIVKNIESIDKFKKNIKEIEQTNESDIQLYDNRKNVIICAGSLSFMKEIYGVLV